MQRQISVPDGVEIVTPFDGEAKELGSGGGRVSVSTLWETAKVEITLRNARHAGKRQSASRWLRARTRRSRRSDASDRNGGYRLLGKRFFTSPIGAWPRIGRPGGASLPGLANRIKLEARAAKTRRRPKPGLRRLGLGVPGEMLFNALGEEAFTATLTPASEGRPSTFGAHARTKPVLLLACAFGRLECAFHSGLRGQAEWSE